MAGGISGDAPLFERFSLGDSRTLRGWDKYDIAPAGGDRMFHTSLEYRYRGLALFLDSGSVWDDGSDARVRVAAGYRLPPGPILHDGRLPAQHRRCQGGVHDGHPVRRHRLPEGTRRERIIDTLSTRLRPTVARTHVALVIVAALAWPAARLASQSLTVTAASGVVHVRAPGFASSKASRSRA